jgi:hypothetical protein
MFKKFIISCLLVASAFTVTAAPIYIDHENKNYWTNVDMDMDFMDLTETEGYTYEELVSLTQSGNILDGWRLASGAESRELYQSFAGGLISLQGWRDVHYDNALLWFRLFGHSDGFNSVWNDTSDTPTDYVTWVQTFNEDKVAAHVSINATQGWFGTFDFGFTDWALEETYEFSPYAGLLTRSAVNVDEPYPASVMLLGALFLAIRRFLKR